MKNIMYKTKIFTKNLKAKELNIIDALKSVTYTIDSLTRRCDNNMAVDTLI